MKLTKKQMNELAWANAAIAGLPAHGVNGRVIAYGDWSAHMLRYDYTRSPESLAYLRANAAFRKAALEARAVKEATEMLALKRAIAEHKAEMRMTAEEISDCDEFLRADASTDTPTPTPTPTEEP
jgi:hypothetical protein